MGSVLRWHDTFAQYFTSQDLSGNLTIVSSLRNEVLWAIVEVSSENPLKL